MLLICSDDRVSCYDDFLIFVCFFLGFDFSSMLATNYNYKMSGNAIIFVISFATLRTKPRWVPQLCGLRLRKSLSMIRRSWWQGLESY